MGSNPTAVDKFFNFLFRSYKKYSNCYEFDKYTFFGEDTKIDIDSCYKYKKFIIDLRKILIDLRDKNEINITLNIIDTKINLYLVQKFYHNKNSKLEEKEERIYFDNDTWCCIISK